MSRKKAELPTPYCKYSLRCTNRVGCDLRYEIRNTFLILNHTIPNDELMLRNRKWITAIQVEIYV